MNPVAQKLIQSTDIPPIPKVLQDILALADNPKTSSTDLEKIVEREPALTAELLKWVNSAFYSLPRRVSSIGHAMILLGFSTVKSIASGMILINVFEEDGGLDKSFLTTVWKHTLTAANIMRIVAKREGNQKLDDLFLAAMIHDIGALVLCQSFGARYKKLVPEGEPHPDPSDEHSHFAVTHCEAAEALLTEWKFPEDVIALVTHHHDLDLSGESDPAKQAAMQRDLNYLTLCNLLGYQKDLGKTLAEPADALPPDLTKALADGGFDWELLRAQRTEILNALAVIDQLFK